MRFSTVIRQGGRVNGGFAQFAKNDPTFCGYQSGIKLYGLEGAKVNVNCLATEGCVKR